MTMVITIVVTVVVSSASGMPPPQSRRGRRPELRNLPFRCFVGGGSGADELKTNRGRSPLLQKLCRAASPCPRRGENTDRNQARTSLTTPN